jgi:hypothetical protein
MKKSKGLQMRYIMILSLCLAGFQGYAATRAEDAVSPILVKEFPATMEGQEFSKVLEHGSITDGSKTWKIVGIYPYSEAIKNMLRADKDTSALPKLDKKMASKLFLSSYPTAAPQFYSEANSLKIDGTVTHFNKKHAVYYFCGYGQSAFYVLFNLVEPESIH